MIKVLASLVIFAAATVAPASAQWAMTCTQQQNSSVNLRIGPGKNNRIVASIPNESYVRALTWVWGSDGMRWWKVEANGLIGWMRGDYMCR